MAKLRKKAKKRLTIFFLLILIIGGYFAYKTFFENKKMEEKGEEKMKVEDPIKTYTAKLIATGDGLVHIPVYNAAKKSDGTYDFTNMLTYTKEKLKDYDIKYYNQETVFDDNHAPEGYPRFNTPSTFGDAMIDAGFNVVSLATNHSMDMGSESAKVSAKWWEDKEDILTHGMASSEDARKNYKIMKVNEITYTMLSYTYGTNGLGTQAITKEPYIVNLIDEEKIKEDILAVRDKVDILIVAMHWGNEYQQIASEQQKEQAKFLADNGVDIVLGNHSHSIQPWEKIGDTIVFYSHGNFISNQMGAVGYPNIQKVGVIGMFSTLDITKTVDTRDNSTKVTIDNIGAELNYTYKYTSNGKVYYTVIPFSKMEDKYLNHYYKGKNLTSVYEEFSNVLKKYDDSIKIEPLPSIETNIEETTTN